jgi:DNA-binding NtrC family response regulator
VINDVAEDKVRDHLFALLIHNHPEVFQSLNQTLWNLSVETYNVETCKEAEELVPQFKPHLIFADVSVWDGSWTYILNLADGGDVPLNVVVVGHVPDAQEYRSAMDRGAFDFVAPPFELALVDFVVRAAATDARNRSEALAYPLTMA